MSDIDREALRTLNERFAELKRETYEAWTSFEQARSSAAEAVATKGADAPELKAAEDLHKQYEAKQTELDQIQDAKMRLFESDPSWRGGRRGGDESGKGAGAWLAHEIKALASGAGVGQAITPVDQPDGFFDLLAPRSVGLASGFSILITERGEVSVPRLTADPQASWTEENQPITEDDPDGDSVTARPRKLAALTAVSSEVFTDSQPAALAVAERSLVRGVSLALDGGFYEGSGVAPQIRGLKNTPGIAVIDLGANGDTLNDLDPFADALGALEGSNATGTAIVMAPRTWTSLMRLKETNDGISIKPLIEQSGGGTEPVRRAIFGVPVYVTSKLSVAETRGTSTDTSSIYIYEAAQIVAVRRLDAELAVDPFYGFNTDQVGIRVIARYDVVVPNPQAVARIRGVRP